MKIIKRGFIASTILILSLPCVALDRATIYKQTASSVVMIFCLDKNLDPVASGTGSFIREDGIILTNNHVITTDKAEKNICTGLLVFMKPEKIVGDSSGRQLKSLGTRYIADVIKNHKRYDLALLKIKNPPSNINTIILSQDAPEDVGSSVLAIGHPGGGSLWTLTGGNISARISNHHGNSGYDVYQTDAAINSGNSGGPLIDSEGNLVGVNTFINRGGDNKRQGLGFAVQTSTINKWLGSSFSQKSNRKKLTPPKVTTQKQSESRLNPQVLNVDPKKLSKFLNGLLSEESSPAPPVKKERTKPEPSRVKRNDTGLNNFLNKLELD